MRLQKYLAQAGIASRRKSEEYIRAGRVCMNGQKVTQMGLDVQENDMVTFDGEPVRIQRRMRYIMLNKPMGVMTTMSDPEGRETVASFVQEIHERVYPVGRLDYDTEGLLLMTNDGELANRLTHPRYGVDKLYLARINAGISEAELEQLRAGVTLDDGHKTSPAAVRVLERTKGTTLVEVIVHEGHNRLVRRMFEAVGKTVAALRREKVGQLGLGGLAVGRWRHLSPGEIKYLKHITELGHE